MRFFYRTVGRIEEGYAPLVDQVPDLDGLTANIPGAEEHGARFAAHARSYRAAELMPLLSARYGPKDSVMDYPTRLVLFTLQKTEGDARLSGWAQKNYQKKLESK